MNIIDTLKSSQLKYLNIKSYNQGHVLFRENSICESIGIVIQGQVSIVSYLNNGNEIIYNILNSNDIFGNNLIFSSEPYYKGNIITNVRSKIALIDRKNLIYLLKVNENFMIEYFKIQSNFTKELNNRIKLLSMDSAQERFFYYMYEHKNEISYSSISDLAKHMYLQRETLSRLLSKLEKQKKIIKNKNSIKVI